MKLYIRHNNNTNIKKAYQLKLYQTRSQIFNKYWHYGTCIYSLPSTLQTRHTSSNQSNIFIIVLVLKLIKNSSRRGSGAAILRLSRCCCWELEFEWWVSRCTTFCISWESESPLEVILKIGLFTLQKRCYKF